MQNNIYQSQRICLVTEEIAGVGGSGGIGAAFFELAKLLAKHGAKVDVLYCPLVDFTDKEKETLKADFIKCRVKIKFLDASLYVNGPYTTEKKSYAITQELLHENNLYDYIHFHDYKGLGFFTSSLKKQGLAFEKTKIVVQLHGPTRWTLDTNKVFFTHEDQLKIDYMEKKSISQADVVVSPSAYLVDWLRVNNFEMPDDVRVIKNVCSDLSNSIMGLKHDEFSSKDVSDIILFARHEDRKGFVQFCDALDIVGDELSKRGITVTFLGKFGSVNSQPSGIYLIERSKKWNFPISVRTGYARVEAVSFITSRAHPIVVIPSPAENSPYTVLETILMGVPVISSCLGGGPELFDSTSYEGLCLINAESLAQKIKYSLEKNLPVPKPSQTVGQIENGWLEFHSEKANLMRRNDAKPLVTFAITHYERTKKLVDAVCSVIQQTYSNIEILVIDDGSKSETALADLEKIEILLARVGGRLIKQKNSYLGAARNCAIKNSNGTYICFLDDDDIAKPELIETLVTAAINTDADAVNCMNIFMDEKIRGDVLAKNTNAPIHISYVPLGGPLSLTPLENCLGAATALFKKAALLEIGGYTELRGVGHEDYELFIRLLQFGKKITIVPKALYYYEVGRPSMLSNTSLIANFKRCRDAIDFSLNSAAWADLTDLHIGKSTQTISHNRQYWLFGQSTNGELKRKLLTHNLNRTEMLDVLIELANAEGAVSIAQALKKDLVDTHEFLVEEYAHVSAHLKSNLHQNAIEKAKSISADYIINTKFDLALGRCDDAAICVIEHIKKAARLLPEDMEFLKFFVDRVAAEEIDIEIWKQLNRFIVDSVVSKDAMPAMENLIVKIAILGEDFDALEEVVSNRMTVDEQQYMDENPDVAESKTAGNFSSGFDHFLKFGKSEGRKGFYLYDDICRFIEGLPRQDIRNSNLFVDYI